jgi:hypothetical protein
MLERRELYPSTSLLGQLKVAGRARHPAETRVVLNTAAARSGLVLGAASSGKTHTLGVILENHLMDDPRIGELGKPACCVACVCLTLTLPACWKAQAHSFHVGGIGAGVALSPCPLVQLASLGTVANGRGEAPHVNVIVSCGHSQHPFGRQSVE